MMNNYYQRDDSSPTCFLPAQMTVACDVTRSSKSGVSNLMQNGFGVHYIQAEVTPDGLLKTKLI